MNAEMEDIVIHVCHAFLVHITDLNNMLQNQFIAAGRAMACHGAGKQPH